MIRKELLLGFFSTGAQVLLLRELVSSLNGDELFIGTALFGWLVAVATGAWWGGRPRLKISSYPLFFTGTLVFWTALVLVRLCPLIVSDIPGEVIPFTLASGLSFVLMTPVGFISGLLFSRITGESRDKASRAVISVYLFEGVGAFMGGVLIAFTAGNIFSTVTVALALGLIVIANSIYFMFDLTDKKHSLVTIALTLFLIVLIKNATPNIEKYLDEIKYQDYKIAAAFDTPYSHQILLTEKGTYTLLTDNRVEAVYPDQQAAENLLLPPLIYDPGATEILLVGRAEFGPAQLAEKLPRVHLTALDRRELFSQTTVPFLPEVNNLRRLYRDPVAYISEKTNSDRYDIIILNVGEPDNHKNNIYFTSDFFQKVKRLLRPNGLLFISTGYDTDRYISDETARILAVIYNSLNDCFPQVKMWPGVLTLCFAGVDVELNLPIDTITARTEQLPIEGDYINPTYLSNRLGTMKVERLEDILKTSEESNRLTRPLLPHYQALYNARKSGSDELVVAGLLNHTGWLYLVPLLLIIMMGYSLTGKRNRYGLMLYFTAGAVSLSLELLSFYIYQSLAGALYSELALLIGTFMLGLALGTFTVDRLKTLKADIVTLTLLLGTSLLFLFTYDKISASCLLTYHCLFLFLTAAATGGLFVAASRKYYATDNKQNRGIGYAWEIMGSAIGALITVTVLLPVIGLDRLMLAIIFLLVIVTTGAFIKSR